MDLFFLQYRGSTLYVHHVSQDYNYGSTKHELLLIDNYTKAVYNFNRLGQVGYVLICAGASYQDVIYTSKHKIECPQNSIDEIL